MSSTQQWTGMAVAASVLVAGLGVGLLALYATGRLGDGDNIAHIESPPAEVPSASPSTPERVERVIVQRESPLENPFDHAPFGAEDLAAAPAPGVPWDVPYAIEPQQSANIVAFVDEQLADNWRAAGIEPAPAIDDSEWAERVAQQLLGREPSAAELQSFSADRSPQKRAAFVEQLLHDDTHRGEFARHWAKIWSCELIDGNALPAQREGLEHYLAAALAADKPFSQITHELLTATGSNDPEAADFNGAVNFVLSGARGHREQIAGTVGRVFLGHQGQCAQCHDAASAEGLSQQQFWQLAAFFQQARPLRLADGATRLVDADYVGPTGDVSEAEIFYDRPDRQRKIAYPVFVDGQAISPSGRVAEVNRRAELARLVVSSEAFSQAAVNQWWKHLLGRAPSPGELQAAQETLARYEGSVAGALEELRWAIENSSEHRPLD